MNAAGLVVLALLWLPPAVALADDAAVKLTLDGRPVDHNTGIAVLHRGGIFADAIDLTKCFDGFISLRRDGSATITIGPNTATFRPGSRHAIINAMVVELTAAPLMRNGDLYVPLAAFIAQVAMVKMRADTARHRADILVSFGPG